MSNVALSLALTIALLNSLDAQGYSDSYANGWQKRFPCANCSVRTTRKHSAYTYPCCASCEDVMGSKREFATAIATA
jgi:hypothetical protein